MMKDPAFPMYAADFLMGTMCMTLEDIGRYAKLLCYQWDKGIIPKKRLGLLVGIEWKNFGDDLAEKFIETDTGIYNERMEFEREKRLKFKEKQTKNGLKGGRPKKGKPILVPDTEDKNPKETQKKPKPKAKKTLLEDENENENIYVSLKKKWNFNFEKIDENFIPVIVEWLEYKRSKRQSYSSQKTFEIMFQKLYNYSNGDSDLARSIIEQSIANNYSGFFELKKGFATKQQQAKQAAYDNTIHLLRRIEENQA